MSAPDRVLKAVKFKAMYFDGVDDYVSAPNSDSLDFGLGDFSVEILFKTKDAGRLLWKATNWPVLGGVGFVVYLRNDLPYIVCQVGDGTNNIYYGFSDVGLIDGKWHHAVVTFDHDGYITGYVDGVQKEPKASSITGSISCTSGLYIAHSAKYNGLVMVSLIYNRVLTAEEVQYNYKHPYNPILNGCVLWLAHDTIDEANAKWYDKSGNGNDGTIYGAVPVEMNKLAGRVLSA